MSWTLEDWTAGLPGRAQQKIRELEAQLEKLQHERQQRQLQLEAAEAALQKQRLKGEEERSEAAALRRELKALAEAGEARERAREQELQVKSTQVCALEGQLAAARKQGESLQQEVKRLQAELEKLQNSQHSGDSLLFPAHSWNLSGFSSPSRDHGDSRGEGKERSPAERARAEPEPQARHVKDATPTRRLGRPSEASPRRPAACSSPSSVFPWERERSPPAPRRPQAEKPAPSRRRTDDIADSDSAVHSGAEEDLRKENEVLQTTVLELESWVQSLERDLRAESGRAREAESQLQAREQSLARCREELSRSAARAEQGRSKCQEAEQRLRQLAEELSCQRQNAESARRSAEQRRRELEREHQKELAEQQRLCRSLESQWQQESSKLGQELQQARAQHHTLQAQADKVALQKQCVEKELAAAQGKAQWADRELQASQRHERELQARLEEALREKDAAGAGLEQSRRKARVLEEQARALAQELAAVTKLLAELQAQQAVPAPDVPVRVTPAGESLGALAARRRAAPSQRTAPGRRGDGPAGQRVGAGSSPRREPAEGRDSGPPAAPAEGRDSGPPAAPAEGRDSGPPAAPVEGRDSGPAEGTPAAPAAEEEEEGGKAARLQLDHELLQDELREARRELELRLEDLEAQRRAEAEARAKLRQAAKKHAAEAEALRRQAAELREEASRLQGALEEQREEASRLQGALEEQGEEASRLQGALEEQREEASRLQGALEEQREEASRLQGALEEQREEAARLQGALEEQREDGAQLREALAFLEAEASQLRHEGERAGAGRGGPQERIGAQEGAPRPGNANNSNSTALQGGHEPQGGEDEHVLLVLEVERLRALCQGLSRERARQEGEARDARAQLGALQAHVGAQTRQLTLAFESQSLHIQGLLADLQELRAENEGLRARAEGGQAPERAAAALTPPAGGGAAPQGGPPRTETGERSAVPSPNLQGEPGPSGSRAEREPGDTSRDSAPQGLGEQLKTSPQGELVSGGGGPEQSGGAIAGGLQAPQSQLSETGGEDELFEPPRAAAAPGEEGGAETGTLAESAASRRGPGGEGPEPGPAPDPPGLAEQLQAARRENEELRRRLEAAGDGATQRLTEALQAAERRLARLPREEEEPASDRAAVPPPGRKGAPASGGNQDTQGGAGHSAPQGSSESLQDPQTPLCLLQDAKNEPSAPPDNGAAGDPEKGSATQKPAEELAGAADRGGGSGTEDPAGLPPAPISSLQQQLEELQALVSGLREENRALGEELDLWRSRGGAGGQARVLPGRDSLLVVREDTILLPCRSRGSLRSWSGPVSVQVQLAAAAGAQEARAMHFRAGPTTDRQAAPSDNRAQEATAARCRRAGAEGSGRDEPTAAAGIADRDPRAGLHSREEAFSSQQVMPSQTAAADFRASANQTKSAQAELADGSATCAQETGAAAAGEDLQDRDAAGEDEGPGAAGASAARGAGMCVAAPETLGHASAPSWRDDGAAGRGAGEEEEPGPACRHERRPPCAGTGSGHEGRVPEDGAPYGGEVGIAGRGARAPGALQRDLAAAQARTEPGGAVSAPGPGSVRTAGTQTEAESEGRAPGSSSLPGKELREVGSQTEPGGDSSAPLGREVCGTGTQTEAAGGVGGDSRLFSQAFPLPADPAQIAERIRRNRARMSVAFDDTEYEPYGLPEVVMKGFADIPSGPACPYVLRRGLLGSTALPPSLREEAGESPQDATD